MTNSLQMPKLGLTMTEGALAECLVQPGQSFKKGQPIFVVETEKTATEIEAEGDGVLQEWLVRQGDTVPVGTVLARWQSHDAAPAPAAPAQKPRVRLVPVVRDVPDAGGQVHPTRRDGRIVATPYARRLAREASIDLHAISSSHPRITGADVKRLIAATLE